MNLYQYNKVRDTINTGDVVFFTGKNLVSDIIEDTTSSVYSHCGIAYWFRLVDSLPKRLFIMESTTLNSYPDESGEFRRGVQTSLLSQRIDSADGPVWLCPLKIPLSPEEENNMLEFLFQRYASKAGYDMMGAIMAGVKDPNVPRWLAYIVHPIYYLLWHKATMKKMFCSEMATKALIVANRISESVNPILQTPALLSKFDCFGVPIKLTGI